MMAAFGIVSLPGIVSPAAAESARNRKPVQSRKPNDTTTPNSTKSKTDKRLTVPAAKRLFVERLQPLLRRKCFGCHGEGKTLEGKLDLRTRAGMLKGGEKGPALVPGKPDESPLYQAVLRTGDLVMPPKDRNKLSPSDVTHLRRWIAAGAPWATKAAVKKKVKTSSSGKPSSGGWSSKEGVVVSTSGGLSADWTNRKYKPEDLWAYRPIQKSPVPDVPGADHPVDAFIRRKLNEHGLPPAPPADRRTLIRRLTFDLTGLPPTPREVEAFAGDKSPQAYTKLVDRLLASKHYGEQQGRHWLDVVRYADTAGFSNDFERPNAWRYRDYVIRSFNADKPFDRFIVEQLAGDELDPEDPENLIAVGFLRMGPWEHTGMSVAAVTRQQYLDDITNSVGVTFLAHALRCAKCHDHKFDPIPTRDYYRIQAVFAPAQFADRRVSYLPEENTANFSRTKPRVEHLLQDAREFLAKLSQKHRRAVAAYLKKRGVKSVKDLPEAERPKRHFGLSALEMSLEKIYRKRIAYFQRELKRYAPLAFSVYSGPLRVVRSNSHRHPLPPKKKRQGDVQPIHILAGGNLAARKDRVDPGVLTAVAGSNDMQTPTEWNTIPESMHGRRLAFARWVANPENTLTARVIVNRIWQQHFGTGIVETPNNFGKMGGKPSHPELLDWLAVWFMEHDWSIKKLHRLIVTSQTYRQSSSLKNRRLHSSTKARRLHSSTKARRLHPAGSHGAQPAGISNRDPNNRLLAYYPPRRLAAEELRDALLAITGELNREMGGPGIYPEINWEVAKQPRHIMGSVAPAYQPSPTRKERHRRTIYAFRYRTLADPMLKVFNRPDSETSCARRDETTVTPQVFALFNGQFAHDRAIALASRLTKQTSDVNEQVRVAFQRLLSRSPTKDELMMCREHVEQMTRHHRRHKPVAVKPPTQVTRQMVEELTGETFTWTEELDLMKNYEPDLKPWDVDAKTRGLAELCLVLLNSNEFVYVR